MRLAVRKVDEWVALAGRGLALVSCFVKQGEDECVLHLRAGEESVTKRHGIRHRGAIALLVLVSVFSVGMRPASADHDVEHRIAQFWQRVDAMQPGDFLSSADLGKWALNVIERNPRARVTVTDFRSSAGEMQAGMDRAGLAPVAVTPAAPATGNVEQRIADFWKRVDVLWPGDFISAAELGQWALNVIERNPRARITVTDFRSSTGGMQAGMDRAGLAPVVMPRFPLLRFQFTAAVPELDRVDIERGTLIGLERLRTTLGEEIGDVVTIYAIASATGERHRITTERSSCCFAGGRAIFGESAAYYDVSHPNWNNPYITGPARSALHRKGGAHELIHVWQDWAGCLITRDHKRPVPVWFFEGMAEYLAYRFAAETGDMPATTVDSYMSWARSEAKRLLATFPLSAIEAQHPPAERGSDINGPAVTAVKMLDESHGRQALRDFCKRGAREDWRLVFTSIFGRPVERFYEEHAAHISQP